MVTIKQIEAGAVKYIDAELAPQIPVNVQNGQLKKVAILACAAYTIHKRVQEYASHPTLAQMGAMDEDGNVDLDGLLDSAKQAMPDTGVQIDVPILGPLTFFQKDLDNLAEYIKEA